MHMNMVTAHKEVIPRTVLKAVIIYDDFDSAAHATTLVERVALRADAAIKWDIKPWRRDVLKQPALAALTIAVAANADLIVLALHRTHVPPAELLDWLKNWAEHRRIEDAAVLTLHADTGSHSAKAWNKIKEVVESHHLTFLGSHKVSTHNGSAAFTQRLQQRKQPITPSARPSPADRLSVAPHGG
jgi:hypothetical protein